MSNELRNWSYKKYKMYRSCPMQVKLKYIERCPEPPPDAKGDVKRLRGITMHDTLEHAVNDGIALPANMEHLTELVDGYRAIGAVAEAEWFFDDNWDYMPEGTWSTGWLQVKLDVAAEFEDLVLTADWKSGKKYGNEIDHFEQMRLYSVAAWRRYPGRPIYTCELQYIDQDDTWSFDFTIPMLEKAIGDFDRAVEVMMTDKLFRPRPNIVTCKYCPYSPRGTGACPVGV